MLAVPSLVAVGAFAGVVVGRTSARRLVGDRA